MKRESQFLSPDYLETIDRLLMGHIDAVTLWCGPGRRIPSFQPQDALPSLLKFPRPFCSSPDYMSAITGVAMSIFAGSSEAER